MLQTHKKTQDTAEHLCDGGADACPLGQDEEPLAHGRNTRLQVQRGDTRRRLQDLPHGALLSAPGPSRAHAAAVVAHGAACRTQHVHVHGGDGQLRDTHRDQAQQVSRLRARQRGACGCRDGAGDRFVARSQAHQKGVGRQGLAKEQAADDHDCQAAVRAGNCQRQADQGDRVLCQQVVLCGRAEAHTENHRPQRVSRGRLGQVRQHDEQEQAPGELSLSEHGAVLVSELVRLQQVECRVRRREQDRHARSVACRRPGATRRRLQVRHVRYRSLLSHGSQRVQRRV